MVYGVLILLITCPSILSPRYAGEFPSTSSIHGLGEVPAEQRSLLTRRWSRAFRICWRYHGYRGPIFQVMEAVTIVIPWPQHPPTGTPRACRNKMEKSWKTPCCDWSPKNEKHREEASNEEKIYVPYHSMWVAVSVDWLKGIVYRLSPCVWEVNTCKNI